MLKFSIYIDFKKVEGKASTISGIFNFQVELINLIISLYPNNVII